MAGYGKRWTKAEDDLLREYRSDNPTKSIGMVAKELETLLDDRTRKGIELRLRALAEVPPLSKPVTKTVKVVEEEVSMYDRLITAAESLEAQAKNLRSMAENIKTIENWAKDTLNIKRMLGFQVNTENGLVEKVIR